MIHDVRSDGGDLIGRLGKVVIIQESDCSAMHVHRTRPFVKLCNSMSLQMEAADSDEHETVAMTSSHDRFNALLNKSVAASH